MLTLFFSKTLLFCLFFSLFLECFVTLRALSLVLYKLNRFLYLINFIDDPYGVVAIYAINNIQQLPHFAAVVIFVVLFFLRVTQLWTNKEILKKVKRINSPLEVMWQLWPYPIYKVVGSYVAEFFQKKDF